MLFRFVKSQHLATSKLFSLGFASGKIFYGSSNPAALELEFFCGPERIHGLRMRTWRQRDSGWARSYFGNVLHPVVKYHRTVGGCLGK
jgi:hypothetical protein